MDGENRSWQGSEGGSTGVGAARALPRCPQAQVGPSGAAGGDSGDGRAPPMPFAHLAVPLEHLVDQFCFPGTGELLVKVLQGDSSKIPPFWSFLAELEDNFHFPGELQSSWILGMRRRGNFIASCGTLGIFQRRPLQVSEVCVPPVSPLCPQTVPVGVEWIGICWNVQVGAVWDPSPLLGAGFGASALGLGMLRTWEPSLL